MRRRSLLVGAGLAMAAAACGKDEDAAETGPVTLSYAVWDKDQVPALKKIADEFTKAHPTVTIDIQLTPNKEYWTKLQTAVTGGNAPDVFWMNGPRIGLYASQKVLLPISDQIAADKVDLAAYPESLVGLYNFRGKQYALPKDYDTIGLWYNKQLFDAAGVKYPDETWTWDTLTQAAVKLTNAGKGVYGIGAANWSQENYYDTIYQAGGFVISPDGKKSGFDDPKTIAGVQFWVDLIHKHKASPTLKQMTDTDPDAMFQSGKVAMLYAGSWSANGYHQNAEIKDKIDVAVLPKGDKRAVMIHGLGNVISAKTKHPQSAWEWVKFLGSQQAQQIQAETGTVISAYKGTEQAWVSAIPQYKLQTYIDQVADSVPLPHSVNTSAWTKVEADLLAEAWEGKRPVADACQAIAQAMNEALAKEA
jgi:multiple sugar transport system substrate-binding protein